MRILFFLGWALVAMAFLSAAAEMASRVMLGKAAVAYSAIEVWRLVAPEALYTFRNMVQTQISPFFWDPVLTTLLILPGWAVFGVPGVFLLWKFHPKTKGGTRIDEDSLFLYDRLAKRAREEGYVDDGPLNEVPHHPLEAESTPTPYAISLPANEADEETGEHEEGPWERETDAGPEPPEGPDEGKPEAGPNGKNAG